MADILPFPATPDALALADLAELARLRALHGDDPETAQAGFEALLARLRAERNARAPSA